MSTSLPVRPGGFIDLEAHGLVPIFPEVMDSSMVKDFMYCPSYFYLRHVLGLQKKVYDVQEDAGRDWGTVWHAVLESYHGALDQGMELKDATIKGLEKVEPWPKSVIAETDKHARSKERMIQIFFNYVEKFGAQDLKDFDSIRAEQFFDVYDDEFGIRWCGRMDRIVRRRRTGSVTPWDYKTTSWMTKYFFEQFEFSFQMPGYARMLSNILTEPVREIIIDVLYTLKKDHQFFRRTIPYSDAFITQWGVNVRNILDLMYWLRDNHLYNPSAWYMNWNHCTMWNKTCTFTDIHWTDPKPSTRLRMLEEDYRVERWDPSREEDE